MKKLLAAVLAITIFLSLTVTVGAAPQLPTKDFEGNTYYCVNTKAQYTSLVNYAINNLLEEVLIYREPDKTEYDNSWSNDVGNFCDYKNYRELTFLDYNTNVVSGYADTKPIFDEYNCYVGHTAEAYGKLQIEYNDSKEEIKQAEAIIKNVLAKVSGKSTVEKIQYIVNYVCSVTESGSTRLPDGGYDLINGVYDVLTGHRTNVVCTSYAVTLQKFFEMAGIDAVMIHNVAHIWNMVCIDGVWYGIDATAGDEGSTMSDRYMLMGYDGLRGFDIGDKTPVATFKARHTLADKGYFSSSSNTTPSSSSSTPASKPSGNQTNTTPNKNSSAVSSTTSSENNSSLENSSETGSVENITEDKKPESAKITVNLTEGAVVSADVFKSALEKGEEVSLVGDGFVWKFSADSIKDSNISESFNAEVYVGDAVSKEAVEAIKQATESKTEEVYPFSFSHHGKLPGEAEITIEVKPELKGKTVYIYYLNDKNEPVAAGKGVVTEDNTLTFTTDHCSVWFLSQDKIDSGFPLTAVLIIVGVVLLLAAGGLTAFLLIKRKKPILEK